MREHISAQSGLDMCPEGRHYVSPGVSANPEGISEPRAYIVSALRPYVMNALLSTTPTRHQNVELLFRDPSPSVLVTSSYPHVLLYNYPIKRYDEKIIYDLRAYENCNFGNG